MSNELGAGKQVEVYRYTKASYWVDCVLNSHFATQLPSLLIGDTMEGFRDVVYLQGSADCPVRLIYASTAYDGIYRVLCLTRASNREKDLRHWHEHGDDGSGVRIRIELLSENIFGRDFVVSPVEYVNIETEYLSVNDIKHAMTKPVTQPCFAFYESAKWLFRKREAYSWEDEIRIVVNALLWENDREYSKEREHKSTDEDVRKYLDFIRVGSVAFPGRIIGVDFGWKVPIATIKEDVLSFKKLPTDNIQFRTLNFERYRYESLSF